MSGSHVAAEVPDQTGRTAVVTGASVFMAARDERRGLAARDRLCAEATGELEVVQLDLSDLELDRWLRAGGVPVMSVLAHPGFAATNLPSSSARGIVGLLLRVGNALVAQPAERDAARRPHRNVRKPGPAAAGPERHRPAHRPAAVGDLDGPHRRPIRVPVVAHPRARR